MTKAIYYTEMTQTKCSAQILSITEKQIILNQTVFYAQGGGQPSDTGIISWEGGQMKVSKVFWNEDQIIHTGEIHGKRPTVGQNVECKIDEDKRKLHSQLHSAGHLIDMALRHMAYELKPNKGFHYPEGAYVEYEGSVESPENFIKELEAQINKHIQEKAKTSIQIGEYKLGKRHRRISFGDYSVPCGGTHVNSLSELQGLYIRKIKCKKGKKKISYGLK